MGALPAPGGWTASGRHALIPAARVGTRAAKGNAVTESRKLAAILVADVVGYSRLAGADEDRILARLRALRSDLIDPTLAIHNGRVVKRTGDGALVEFRSVVDAVRCAIEIQHAMVERNAGVPDDRRIEFRIGIHLGDVVEESDGDLMGDGVNIAARLEGIAAPGAIALSEDAYRQVKARLDLLVSDLGDTKLKNIAEPIRVYSLQVGAPKEAAAPAPAVVTATAALALPDRPSIAVLPFQNMGGDPEQEYFADGMVEDIITGLSRIHWLFVIARNSSFVYKGKAVDIKQVGRELGVRYVLEGSVRKGGNKLRITGQLIEAETGTHLWADRYDGDLKDVFELQDKITETVIGVIEPNIRSAEIERARRKPPESLGAYDLYLRALPHLASMMPEDANKAGSLFEQALALDPDYAVVHAYLAWVYEMRVARGGFSEADAAAGMRHARAAIVHGADDPTALAIAALVLLHLGRDFPAASNAVTRALELNHSSAIAYFFGSHINAFCGETATARDYAQRGLRLSPFDALAWIGHQSLGVADLREQQYDAAAVHFGKAMQINPRFSYIYMEQCTALALAGRIDEARAAVKRLLELEPNFSSQAIISFLSFVRPELSDAWRAGLSAAGAPA
jgi:TolB-like protein/class 3 adenylate cyclase/Tfp pilus assembly protein PilF